VLLLLNVMPNPIPEAYRAVTPYLIVDNAAKAIEFYMQAFGATEFVRLADATGKVMHAELRVNNSPIMLADEFPEMGYRSPRSLGGSPVSMLLFVEDVDALVASATAAGAVETMPAADQFDGDRRGTLTDPFGHVWLVAGRKEDITVDELQRRFQAMMDCNTV
jgi:PhnB protein